MILLSALLGVGPTYYYAISAVLLSFCVVIFVLPKAKEIRRKIFVALKRKPQNIPLVMITCCFMWYSFNLSLISFTTTKVQSNTGLMSFVIMLMSILVIVCCMRAFPYRKKAVIPMLVLTFVLLAVIFTSDILYLSTMTDKINTGIITESTTGAKEFGDVLKTKSLLTAHSVMLAIAALLTATLPVYRKWIRKINTSIEIEESSEMAEIDISGE